MTNTQKRILSYSFVTILITEFLEQVYADIDISVATNSELFVSSLIHTFNHFSLAVGLSGMLIIGIRTIRKPGFSIKSILMPSIGFILILLLIYLSSSSYHFLESSSEFIKSKPHYAELLTKMEISLERQDIPADRKAFLSKYYARTKYEKGGLIIDYSTPEGTVTTYKPTPEEVTQRNEMLKSEVEAIFWSQLAKRTIWGSLIFWTILTIVSILTGIFSPISGTKSHH